MALELRCTTQTPEGIEIVRDMVTISAKVNSPSPLGSALGEASTHSTSTGLWTIPDRKQDSIHNTLAWSIGYPVPSRNPRSQIAVLRAETGFVKQTHLISSTSVNSCHCTRDQEQDRTTIDFPNRAEILAVLDPKGQPKDVCRAYQCREDRSA